MGLNPRSLIMENVRDGSGKMRLVFAEIMEALKTAGYNVSAEF